MNKLKQYSQTKLLQQTVLFYYILVIISSGILSVLFWFLQTKYFMWYIVIFCLLHIQWAVVNYKFAGLNKPFMPFYYIFMVTFLFPVVWFLWQIQVYTIMLLYMLLPMIIMYHHYISKYTIYASCCSAFCIVVIIIISDKIKLTHIDTMPDIIYTANIIITLLAMMFIIMFIYFYNKNFKFKIINSQNTKANNPQLEELYNSVIAYFDKKQPYRKPNYRLSMLAKELNTNTKYLSDAINANYRGNFESLLNKYRLDCAKKMLEERLADKYTIEYIYTSAGYSNRSTFYENFRKTFQMTPLEYQNMQSP